MVLCLGVVLQLRHRRHLHARYPALPAVDPRRAGHSPDRRWWFDGRDWRRAVSADGRRWFDGRRWRPNRRRLATVALNTGFALLATYPIAVLLSFGYLAGEPKPRDYRYPAWTALVGPGVIAWPVVALILLGVGTVLFLRRPLRRPGPRDRPPDP